MVLSASENRAFLTTANTCMQPNAEELFTLYKDRVYSIALRFSGDPAEASDISQQVFIKLMANLDRFRGEAKFDSWLYRMVVNCCLDHRRKNWRWLPFVQEVIEAWQARRGTASEGALDQMLRLEAQAQVQEAVSKLAPEMRIVVVLRYTEGLGYEEIAGILKIPAGTVASRLNRAHRMLEKQLATLGPGALTGGT